jgi:hypothetical protein
MMKRPLADSSCVQSQYSLSLYMVLASAAAARCPSTLRAFTAKSCAMKYNGKSDEETSTRNLGGQEELT